jgi:hypothetical protein
MPMTFLFIAWPLTGVTWLLFGGERIREDIRIVRFGPGAGDEPPQHDLAKGSVV